MICKTLDTRRSAILVENSWQYIQMVKILNLHMWLFAGKGTNRDKTQLNAFLFGCYVTSIDLRVTRKKKEEKNAVNVVLFTQKQETRSTYLTL